MCLCQELLPVSQKPSVCLLPLGNNKAARGFSKLAYSSLFHELFIVGSVTYCFCSSIVSQFCIKASAKFLNADFYWTVNFKPQGDLLNYIWSRCFSWKWSKFSHTNLVNLYEYVCYDFWSYFLFLVHASLLLSPHTIFIDLYVLSFWHFCFLW